MRLRLFRLMILSAALCMGLGLAANVDVQPCLMKPAHLEMRLHNRGLTWLPGEDFDGTCDEVPVKKWARSPAGAGDLFVHADGPSGSGRFWNVTIGVAGRHESKPARGVCFKTSTIGWRTLQQYKKTPLPWLDDLDKKGKAELIVWESFALQEDASMAEYGLVAWVYRLTPEGSFVIDWSLSRQMAREIADAYRAPLDSKDLVLGPLRAQAAQALEQFADERCIVRSVTSGR